MNEYPAVDLRCDGIGCPSLAIEGQPPVQLTPKAFAQLARQFVKAAHEIAAILEPPFVVGLQVQHNVDGDQRTPLFREAWPFATHDEAELFLEWAQADVHKFAIQSPFDLSLPAVPELSFWWPAELTDPATALAQFRTVCFRHFLYEGGDFWDQLPLTEREAMGRIWAAGESLPEFDPAELEAWVAGQKTIAEL